jgi:ribosomal protein S20
MANIRSADKNIRKANTLTMHNQSVKSRIRALRKKVIDDAIGKKDAADVAPFISEYCSVLDKAAKTSVSKPQHVYSKGDGSWGVKSTGASRARSVHATQEQAIKAAKSLAQVYHSELIVHGRDGRVQERCSYEDAPRSGRVQ